MTRIFFPTSISVCQLPPKRTVGEKKLGVDRENIVTFLRRNVDQKGSIKTMEVAGWGVGVGLSTDCRRARAGRSLRGHQDVNNGPLDPALTPQGHGSGERTRRGHMSELQIGMTFKKRQGQAVD